MIYDYFICSQRGVCHPLTVVSLRGNCEESSVGYCHCWGEFSLTLSSADYEQTINKNQSYYFGGWWCQ